MTSEGSEGKGDNWVRRFAAEDNTWQRVAYGNGVFVAVSSDGDSRVMRSTDDGATWTAVVVDLNYWTSVTYGNGVFVAVSRDGTNRSMRSTDDGVTWTGVSVGAGSGDPLCQDICYGNGLFVITILGVSSNELRVSYDDGATWSVRDQGALSWMTNVAYGGGKYVVLAITNGSYNMVSTSPDAVNWTPNAGLEENNWYDSCYGKTDDNTSKFVAVSYMGHEPQVAISSDGEAWVAHNAAEANDWRGICYGSGLFVAVASSGDNRVMTSTNGEDWVGVLAAEQNSWRSVCSNGNGTFVAVSGSGTYRVMTSEN